MYELIAVNQKGDPDVCLWPKSGARVVGGGVGDHPKVIAGEDGLRFEHPDIPIGVVGFSME
jgi:hypothetical protein